MGDENDERVEIEPDAEGGLSNIWIADQPVGKIIDRLNDRVDELEKESKQLQQENTELQQENERLRDRVGELETKVDPDPMSLSYEEMDRDERVRKLRQTLVEEALRSVSRTKAQMKYRDVQFLFDNHPSAGYAYKLMRLAAEADGFEFVDDTPKRIRVNTEAVKDDAYFHTVNKAEIAEAD